MNNNVEIIDDFLPRPEFEELKNTLTGGGFPWFLHKPMPPDSLEYVIPDDATDYNLQFSHIFYSGHAPNGEGFSVIRPLISKINPLALLRVRGNLKTRTLRVIETGYHTDFPKEVKCLTGIFYLNTTDGPTKFKTGEVIDSIENRLVLFDSRLDHTGTTCTNSDIRCVITINFIPYTEMEN